MSSNPRRKQGKVINIQKRAKKGIDALIENEYAKINAQRRAQPLVKAGEQVPKQSNKLPTKTMAKFSENEPIPSIEPNPRQFKEIVPPKETPKVARNDTDEEIYEDDFDEPISSDDEVPVFQSNKRQPTPLRQQNQSKGGTSEDYKMDELKKALQEENQAALKREMDERSDSSFEQSAPNTFFKTRQQNVDISTIKKQEKRNNDLLDIIEMEVESFLFFEMYPMNEFDHMMVKLNNQQIGNKGTQTNDDVISREIQTDDIERKVAEVQWPADMGKVDEGQNVSGTSINKFLRKTVPVLEVLLEENVKSRIQRVKIQGQGTNNDYIQSVLQIESPGNILAERFPNSSFNTTHTAFFPTRRNFIAAAYDLAGNSNIILIWDVQNPKRPSRFLLSESQVSTLLIPKTSEHIVIAGTTIGTILIWDLREASSFHETYKKGQSKFTLRYPTYSSEGLLEEGHNIRVSKLIEIEGAKGQTFQIVSVDQSGGVISWSVVELPGTDLSGSEIDLGLRVGGKVKLVKGNQIDLHTKFKIRSAEGFGFAVNPSDSQELIYSSGGKICHTNRFGGEAYPEHYKPVTGSNCSSIAYSLTEDSSFILAGYQCGSLALYNRQYSNPIIEWLHSASSIVRVGFDPVGKASFFAIDSQQTLQIWDLGVNISGPTLQIQLGDGSWKCLDWVLPESSKQNPLVAIGNQSQIFVYSLNIPVLTKIRLGRAVRGLPGNVSIPLPEI